MSNQTTNVMKKTKTKQFMQLFLYMGLFALITFTSCDKDDPVPVVDPVASYQYAIDAEDFLKVSFTNFSQNATSYSWNFGDNQTSTEENPTHTYAQAGSYNVVLVATNSAGKTANYSQSISITDPREALKMLTGDVSKTWRLYREGTSMSLGPDATNPAGWWEGLENNGQRPCMYNQEFTFFLNGDYKFDDKGSFWGEYGVWGAVDGHPNSPLHETCFEAIPANMVNAAGNNVSAWLSGTHKFTYDPAAGKVTLTGQGAWIGIPKLGTTGTTIVPASSVTFDVSFTEETGYDLMTIVFDHGSAGYWKIVYASYSNPSLEPAVVTEQAVVPPLEKITPTEIFITFAADNATEKATISVVESGSTVTFGVDDPADATAKKVGQFNRTANQHQELKFKVTPEPKDILFTNFNTAKVDVYIPAATAFPADGMQRKIVLGFADESHTPQWWESPTQFILENDDVVLGEWKTYSFDLTDVKAREDIDMIYLQIGGGGHTDTGTFYVRNLIFE
jgi:PKD repeat protein